MLKVGLEEWRETVYYFSYSKQPITILSDCIIILAYCFYKISCTYLPKICDFKESFYRRYLTVRHYYRKSGLDTVNNEKSIISVWVLLYQQTNQDNLQTLDRDNSL